MGVSRQVFSRNKNKSNVFLAPIQVPTPDKNPMILLAFNFASTELSETSKSVLNQTIARLKADPGLGMNIVGHTDSVGSDHFNMHLSRDRAREVEQYCLDKGIAYQRLHVKFFGGRRPLSDDPSINRRVELTLIKAGV